MKATSLLAAAVFVVAGCAASGRMVSEAQLASFKVGEATEEEVLRVCGEPQVRTRLSDGTSRLAYSYASYNALSGKLITRSVSLTFGPNGKLTATESTSGKVM